MNGFRFSAVPAGIKHPDSDRLDLGLIVAESEASAAAVTTTNLVCAAPVTITRQRIAKGVCRAVLVNSGNANAYTGERGIADTLSLTAAVARDLGISDELVVPMSTGVIGNPLPVERIVGRIPELVGKLDSNGLMDVARAIMTTDTRPKITSLESRAASVPFRLVGLAKGAGMIAPNMATMLAVVLADVRVEAAFLKEVLVDAAERTFNSITVDGDTSTNDTLLVLAGGAPGCPALSSAADRKAFALLLNDACTDLAHQLVQDGEGATKLVTITVRGAANGQTAARIARVIAESPLVKTAFHGEDPNWGRIIAAAGRAGVPFDPDRIDLFIGDAAIVKHGVLVAGDWESGAHTIMKASEFSITLDLKSGDDQATMLTTDLSEEYVTINADYRS